MRTLPLTLLSAPAGYGKTTMLAMLPHLLPELPLAWITLDAEENDPIRFIGLLAVALQRLHPGCGRSVFPLLAGGSSDGESLKRAVGALVGDIFAHLPDPFVLVLDDLHWVTEPAVYLALEYLLDHQPPQLHLAVGTRHDPPLRLARLAARRQLGELRRPDLGFRLDEAQQLLNGTLGLSLEPAEVEALQERTEGWPAGLCLLAGPLGRLGSMTDRTHLMAALPHTERYALDFLADEVLRTLPADLRRFLLETSVLAEMTPSACRAVTGRQDAAEVLEQLYRQNLTIAAIAAEAAGEPAYRHHALFARLLARQLQRELPGEIPELHRRAARVQSTPGRAIAHYMAAGLWDEAAQLMVESGMHLLRRGMAETVRTWVNSLPAESRSANPYLSVLLGRCAIHTGDYEAAAAELRQAREAFVARGDIQGEGEALTSLITLANQFDDRSTAAALVERAMRLPLEPMGQVAAPLFRAWLRLCDCDWEGSACDVRRALAVPRTTGDRRADLIGITYLSAPLAAVPGCLEPTERYCAEVCEASPPDTAWRLGAEELGTWPLLWRGRLAEAEARASAAEALRQGLGGYPFVGTDLPIIRGLLALARGDAAAAEQAADALLTRMESAPRSKWPFYLQAAGRALALTGRLAEAKAMTQRLAARCDGVPLTDYLHAHLAGLLALLDGAPEAAERLSRAAALEERLPIAWVGGSARLLLARLQLDQGCADAALAAAAPVLSRWEASATPGCALLDGPIILPVLRLAAQRGIPGGALAAALFGEPSVQDRDVPAPPGAASGLVEPLTQRECDVLRLVVAGRTNRQIGEELYITEETVKSHVAHILRKLDVTSRTQAAVRGRELGF